MRLICTLIWMVAATISLSAQVSYDTSYTRQWNNKTSEWESFDRIISTFEDGLVTSEMIQVKKDDFWINYNFKAYYYDNGLVVEEFEQYWNEAKLRWEDNYRKLYTYDGEGKLMLITHQNIFKGKYINTSKEILIYTSDGKLKEKIIQKFVNKEADLEKAWSNFLRYQYYYNSNDLLINENLAEWKINSWEENTVFLYDYDYNGRLLEKTRTKVSGNKSRNMIREIYAYDENDQIKAHFISEWNYKKKIWIESYRALYENNLYPDYVSLIIQKNENDKSNNYICAEFCKKYLRSNKIEIADLMTFSLDYGFFGNIATIRFNNPYKETYYVSVHNADGQLIGSDVTKNDQITLDSSFLEKGSYYVELQGSNLYSGKFSIE